MQANINMLDADDATIEAAFPEVPYDSKEWDEEDDHWTPNDATRVYTKAIELRFFDMAGPYDNAPDANWSRLAPIVGGCEHENEVAHVTEEPFEPSEEDWQEYHHMMDEVDRTTAYLDGFNAERNDDSEVPA